MKKTISQSTPDHEVWQNLKGAIAESSGFKRWQAEKLVSDEPLEPTPLEIQVRSYLKETLETLAY
jgi:hypothetical protein